MLTLPIHDLPTRNASGFLLRYVLPRSLPPQLVGPTDRKFLFSTLTIGDIIIGVGHGAPSVFCGHNDQVILDVYSIPDVRGKVVILISCETAQVLGPELIKAGAASYLGFQKDLTWIVDADLASTPWGDNLAAPVMMPIVDCVNGVLDGKTTEEAFAILIDQFSRNSEVEEDELIRACLNFNKKNALLLGNPEARLRARPKIQLPLPPPPIIAPIFKI